MTNWDFNILSGVLETELVNAPENGIANFRGFSIDSRTIKSGEVFFAIVGDNNDGHQYVSQAFEKGASVAVINKSQIDKIKSSMTGPLFIVEDTHVALLEIAAYLRRHMETSFAGVTGSNGKTTTKEMLYAIADVNHKAFRSPGNLNNLYGLPISLGMMPEDTEYAVFELGISTPGEMSRLAAVIKPELALITNIGPAHLETLGSIENVVKAKFELIDTLPVGALVVLNADDTNLMTEAKRRNLSFIGFGIDNPTDFTATDLDVTEDGLRTFVVNGQQITLNAIGRVNVYNALAAIAASSVWGCLPEEWSKGLNAFIPDDLRMKQEQFNGLQLLIDCYNANPDSVSASLEAVKELNVSARKIAVLGDMLELGSSSDDLHRKAGQMAADAGIDYLFCLGPQSRHIRDGAISSGMNEGSVMHTEDKQDLLDSLLKIIEQGDLILFKASRGMELEKIIHGLKASAFKNN
ncbi:MAG: UDP-N-acetylmuramoyl-tripeptide--D-alanyl-D-alanine ligase [candidate division Zixibacteria bacterium]|nr:UDP-N-acetylmuramoyl-tripeptide--D-alanyl-D-alanine ligase [candidate division Zixibacteria bacterium]